MANKKKDNEWVSWGLIIFLFLIGLSPIALILLLVKLFGSDTKKTQSSGAGRAARERGEQTQSNRASAAVRKVTKSPTAKKSTAKWLKIAGGVVMLLALMANWDYLMWFLNGDIYWWEEVLQMMVGLIGGGAMFASGASMSKNLKRYAKYLAVMGDRDAIPVEELCRTLGYSRRQVEKDLQKMIDKGYFGGKAYLHMERGCLFRSGDADAAWAKREEEKKQAAAEEVKDGYAGILQSIRRANDRIDDPVLSEKIDRIEAITAKIFRAVEADPRKQGQIATFLNYYLPTTQKLLDSYAEFESAGVEGENLSQAKQRIEATMDKIVRGFEHQLDQLYKSDALDVDSDIRVMESMLRRDTASVEEDFGITNTEK